MGKADQDSGSSHRSRLHGVMNAQSVKQTAESSKTPTARNAKDWANGPGIRAVNYRALKARDRSIL